MRGEIRSFNFSPRYRNNIKIVDGNTVYDLLNILYNMFRPAWPLSGITIINYFEETGVQPQGRQ